MKEEEKGKNKRKGAARCVHFVICLRQKTSPNFTKTFSSLSATSPCFLHFHPLRSSPFTQFPIPLSILFFSSPPPPLISRASSSSASNCGFLAPIPAAFRRRRAAVHSIGASGSLCSSFCCWVSSCSCCCCCSGMNSVFSEQILGDKLSKLNSTQQCIETLSHWCIFHRGKAELVVATWDKQFHNSEMVQKVPLLYLANDILQNSKRKGNEFVTEFWKVLPAALKDVHENGDSHGKNVISRLVDIWEQRKVFGSRTRSLKDVILGEEAPPPLEFSKKRTRSVRIVKRDSRSMRTKLSIGSAAEKIVSAFHLVLSEYSNEETEMSKCNSAVQRVRKMENDVDFACSMAKNPQRKQLAKELEEEESILKQCIEKLQSVEASRMALMSQLKEALHVQESELENIRTQMQVAQAQAEEAKNMQNRLNDEGYLSKSSTTTADSNAKSGQKKSAAAIAAEVADKLAASSSSQMIMTSVLSTFAAEEAKNTGLAKTNNGTKPMSSSANSITKPETSAVGSDPNVFMSMQPLPAPANHSYQSVIVPQPTMQSHTPNSQTQYQMLPSAPSQQYLQLSNGVLTPYGYGSLPSSTPAPPPPMPHMVSSVVPLTQQMLQQPIPLAQQPSPMIQTLPVPFTQQPLAPSFRPLQPPGMVYYGHPPPSH